MLSLVDDDLPPTRTRFTQRSAWMVAHATRTLLVEAAQRSAALVAVQGVEDPARLAAVPGPILSAASAGPNALIAAHRATSVHNAEALAAFLT